MNNPDFLIPNWPQVLTGTSAMLLVIVGINLALSIWWALENKDRWLYVLPVIIWLSLLFIFELIVNVRNFLVPNFVPTQFLTLISQLVRLWGQATLVILLVFHGLRKLRSPYVVEEANKLVTQAMGEAIRKNGAGVEAHITAKERNQKDEILN